MSALRVTPVVEGQGEVAALPILLRRIAQNLEPEEWIEVSRPIRVSRNKVVKEGALERTLALAAEEANGGAILLLLDADDDCPAELGPQLLRRARMAGDDDLIEVALAKAEFESWFIAAARSLELAGKLIACSDLPSDPEGIRDAKGWLSAHMPARQSYSPTLDQPSFAALCNLSEANAARSFVTFQTKVARLITGLRLRRDRTD